jgi:glutaredoxin 3
METRVLLYSQPDCRACGSAKEFLARRGVRYKEKNIRGDYQALYELIDDLGSRQTPTLVVGERVIAGYDPAEYDAALTAVGE